MWKHIGWKAGGQGWCTLDIKGFGRREGWCSSEGGNRASCYNTSL